MRYNIINPSTRISTSLWREVREWMLENDPDTKKTPGWRSPATLRPQTPDDLARKIIWVILCAGRNYKSAKTLESKIFAAIKQNKRVYEIFGFKDKANAIEGVWSEREYYYSSLNSILEYDDVDKLLNWCISIPYIGKITKYHLAKNLGANLVKPDIWLCRLAGISDDSKLPVNQKFSACMTLVQSLARETEDNLAAVDSLLWLACVKGVLTIEDDHIYFRPEKHNNGVLYVDN